MNSQPAYVGQWGGMEVQGNYMKQPMHSKPLYSSDRGVQQQQQPFVEENVKNLRNSFSAFPNSSSAQPYADPTRTCGVRAWDGREEGS